MANTKSAQKHVRSDERKRLRNLKVRSKVKTLVKKAREDMTIDSVRLACAELDKAASKGTIHKNNAARRKSRLMARYNRLHAAQAATA